MSPRLYFLVIFLVTWLPPITLDKSSDAVADELQFPAFPAEAKNLTGRVRISDLTKVTNSSLVQNRSSEQQSGLATCDTDILYWIISTRHLPHEITGCPKVPTFCLLKRRACGQLEPGTFSEFQSWLTPGTPVMLMVHGSFVDWELSQHDAHGTYCWMQQASCGRPVKMVFLSWPSDGPYTRIPAIDVTRSGRRAAYDGIYLSYLIDCIPANSPICLMGHSHGARVIASALHFRAGGEIYECCRGRPSDCRRIRVIFAAAAFDHCWLNPGNRYGLALTQVECFVNLQNRLDAALTVYPLVVPFSARSIAKAGLTRRDSVLQGELAYRTIEYDVTRAVGVRHTWPNYYNQADIGNLVAPYVFNWGIPQSVEHQATVQLGK